MPIAAALNSMWEVKFNGKLENQVIVNVFHFSCVGASSDVDLHLIQVIAACFVTHLLPVLTSGYTLENVTWKQVSPSLGVEQTTIPAGTLVGGGTAAALPSYCSAVVSKVTAVGGRSHRGRIYFGGIPEDQTTNSKITNGGPFWVAMGAFIECVLSEFVHPDPAGGTDLFDLIVYSRKIGGATFPYSNTGATAITNLVPHLELGTTRSRKLGRGA